MPVIVRRPTVARALVPAASRLFAALVPCAATKPINIGGAAWQ